MNLQAFAPIILIAIAFSSPAFAKDKEKQGEGDKRTVVHHARAMSGGGADGDSGLHGDDQ